MSRKLALIAVGGIAIGTICLGVAVGVGGGALRRHGFDGFPWNDWQGGVCDLDSGSRNGSRTFTWSSGDTVKIALPANVHYRPGPSDKLVIAGNEALLRHLEVKGSKIGLNCHLTESARDLEVTLPGLPFRKFTLTGSGNLDLEGLDQPDLTIESAGSGDIKAAGHADRVTLEMAGSGDADLGALQAGSVRADIAGSGDIDVMPKDDLTVNIAGSGDVRLHSEPAHIESHIFGSGEIIHPDKV